MPAVTTGVTTADTVEKSKTKGLTNGKTESVQVFFACELKNEGIKCNNKVCGQKRF